MSTSYTYNIITDFTNGVNTEKLSLEILDQFNEQPSILITGEYIKIRFSAPLNQNQISELNSIIGLHDTTEPPVEGNCAYDDPISATTTKCYRRKLRLTHTTIEEDNYLVFWSFNYRSSGMDAVDIQVTVDGTEVHRLYEYPDADQEYSHHDGGFAIVHLTVGKHDIDVNLRGVNGNATYIWNTRLCVKSTSL